MAKKIKYEKVREIVKLDNDGNVVTQKLTGNTGGYTRETTPALAVVGNENKVNNKGSVKANTIKTLKSDEVEKFDNDIRTVDTVSQYKQTKKDLKEAENNLKLKTKERQEKEKEIYDKVGQEFSPKFKNLQKEKISYLSKNNKLSALPEQKITRQEVDNQVAKELDEEEKAYNDYKIANYLNNVAKVNNEKTDLWDKTGGNVVRAIKDLVSPLTMGDESVITDEKGNKIFLPSYNELKQKKVQKDYGNNLVGNLAKVGGNIAYQGTKVLGAGAVDLATAGIGGKALYWTDMAQDNYKNIKNQGYSNKEAIANTIVSTGTEFLTTKVLSGLAKPLTGGKASVLQNKISKVMDNVVKSPEVSKVIGSMGSEALEEFTQTWIGALNDKVTLGQDSNIEDLVKDSLYSALVGAGTAGLSTSAYSNINNIVNPTIKQQPTINTQPVNNQVNQRQSINQQETLPVNEQVTQPTTSQQVAKEVAKPTNEVANQAPIQTQPVTQRLTTEEQTELNNLKNLPFELGKEEDTRLDNLLIKQNEDVKNQMSPVRDLTDVRNYNEVGNRKVNAYQYENPEVKPYFQEVASSMLADLDMATKGERYMTPDGQWKGVKRNVANDIAELLDGVKGKKYTYKQIEDGLNAIINDKGAENNAVSKRIEFYIDQRLRNGFTDATGEKINPNERYISTLRDKNIESSNNLDGNTQIIQRTQENFAEEKAKEDVITIKNNNLNDIPKDQIRGEDTGVSIGGKSVQTEIPIDSKPNKLGQYIPKDGFTKKDLKSGKLGDSKFYKNATERADFIRDEVREKIKDDDYVKHYKKVTNEESMQEAFNDLNTRGTEAIADFFNNDKELTSKDTAMGWLLIEQAQENGDYDFSTQVLRKMRSNATKTGQTMQMYNYYARLTPEGMYRWCGDQLLRAEEIFEKNKTKKWIENNKDRWQLNGEEVEFIKNQMEKVQKLNKMNDNSTTTIDVKGKQKKVSVERAKQVEIAKIQAMIENKIPPEKGQALNAWMRIAMLGNLKTIGTRNPLGNFALRPINDVGDFVGSIADYAISKKTGVRTKGNFNPKAQVKGLVKGGAETAQDARLKINTRNAKGNRFEIKNGKSFNDQHKGVAKVLNPVAKFGNKLDSGVSFLLDLGDRPFYEASYEQSLQNQMKLNGIKNREDVTDWMKAIAEKEGMERTYQDDNNYTSAVLDIRKAMNKFNFKGYGLGDVLIPFAKTPANLTKAIVDYSPAGFVNAITKGNNLRKSISNGQFTPEMQHDFVNQLGKATAGTMLYVIGKALADSGLITGGADEDKDVADFMKNTLGIQPYSIKVGNQTFTYDWAQPISSSLAISADIKKGIEDSKKGEVDLEYIIHKSFNSAGNILLEQSFLQGIKDVLGGYGDPLDNLISEIEGLPARAVPTLMQQITTYLDGTKRMSYGNKGVQNIISQAKAKTPWAKDLPVYRNSLGKEIKMYGGKNNFFNVFINPANYSEGNASESAKEIYKVYQATNDKRILPRLVDNQTKNEDGTNLTNKQKSDFLKISGDIIEKNVKELKDNYEYKNMSDEDKSETIKAIVDYAYNKARKEITGHKLSSTYKKAENAENSGYALADYYITRQNNKTTRTTSDRNRYQELADKGIDGKTYDKFNQFVSSARGESRSGGLSKKEKIINYIESLPLSAEAKENLYQDYIDNSGTFQYYR